MLSLIKTILYKIKLKKKFASGSNLSKDKVYMEFYNKKNYTFVEKNEKLNISASVIHGISYVDKDYFWNHHSRTKDDYINLTLNMHNGNEQAVSNFYYDPIKVYKFKDIYILLDDGRHRVTAAQELGINIDVILLGEYFQENN